MQEFLEATMLMCFSVSWYWSIAKMLQTRQASGKSATFVMMVVTGYVFGLASKIVTWRVTGIFHPIIFLYLWNLFVTAFDLWLVMKFSSRQPRGGQPA